MSNKANELYTSAVPVSWAYLMAPDTAFNAKKHAINIVVTDELEGQIKSQFGIAELNKNTMAGFMPAKDSTRRCSRSRRPSSRRRTRSSTPVPSLTSVDRRWRTTSPARVTPQACQVLGP